MEGKKSSHNNSYIRISKIAPKTPYSAAYISFLARKGKIDAKKIGRNWHVNPASIQEYLYKQGIPVFIPKAKPTKGKLRTPVDPKIILSSLQQASGRAESSVAEKTVDEQSSVERQKQTPAVTHQQQSEKQQNASADQPSPSDDSKKREAHDTQKKTQPQKQSSPAESDTLNLQYRSLATDQKAQAEGTPHAPATLSITRAELKKQAEHHARQPKSHTEAHKKAPAAQETPHTSWLSKLKQLPGIGPSLHTHAQDSSSAQKATPHRNAQSTAGAWKGEEVVRKKQRTSAHAPHPGTSLIPDDAVPAADPAVERFVDAIESRFKPRGPLSGLVTNLNTISKHTVKKTPSRMMMVMVAVVVLLFVVVGGFGFAHADRVALMVKNAIQDATTLQGRVPGTHANDVLLLDSEGKISIYGHVETRGQLRSFVDDGIAPIVVNSRTTVENLSAEYLDGLASEEFTLAFVTQNGNIAYEKVFLEGGAEIADQLRVKGSAAIEGELLVHGATRLLDELLVYGELRTLSSADIGGALTVRGAATFEDHVRMRGDADIAGTLDVHTVDAGNVNVKTLQISNVGVATRFNASELSAGELTVRGSGTFGGGLTIDGDVTIDGTITTGDQSVTDLDATNVDISGDLTVAGHTALNTLTATGTAAALRFRASDRGTGAIPAFSFTQDPDTGLFAPATSTLALSTAGSERLRVTSAGNVGIGTTTPNFTLDVSGTGRFTGPLTLGTQATTGDHALRADRTLTMTGTPNQIAISAGAQNLTANREWIFSLPQDIATSSSPTFANLTLTGALAVSGTTTLGDTLTVSGDILPGTDDTHDIGSGVSRFRDAFLSRNLTVDGLSTLAELVATGTSTAHRFLASDRGSQTIPAFSFTQDPDTGLFAPATSTLALTTAGSERLRITADGNVGLGILSPLARLHTRGGDVRFDDATQTPGFFLSESTGRVGIGTATTTAGRLVVQQLVNNETGGITFLDDGGRQLRIWSTGVSGGIQHIETAESNQTLRIGTGAGGGPVNLKANDSVRLTVSAAGNVGVGETAPGRLFHVAGDTRIDGALRMGGDIVTINQDRRGRFADGSAATAAYGFTNDIGLGMFRAGSNLLGFTTAGSERLRITADGNVGIATSTPAFTLDVAGDGRFTSNLTVGGDLSVAGDFTIDGEHIVTGTSTALRFLASDRGTDATPAFSFSDDDNTGIFSPGANLLALTTAGTERLRITADGNVGIGVTDPTQALEVDGITRTTQIETNLIASLQGDAFARYEILQQSHNFRGGAAVRIHDENALQFFSGTRGMLEFSIGGSQFAPSVIESGFNESGWFAPLQFQSGVRTDVAADAFIFDTTGNITESGSTLLSIRNAGTEQAHITKDGGAFFAGNVGIGTASTDGSVLAVQKNTLNPLVRLVNESTSGNEASMRFRARDTSSITTHIDMGIRATGGDETGYFFVRAPFNETRFVVTTGGNVGIGMTTPIHTLDVSGTGRFSSDLHVGGDLFVSGDQVIEDELIVTGDVTARRFLGSDFGAESEPTFSFSQATSTGIFAPATSTIALSTAGSERLRVTAGGNVGIGTTDPGEKLDVAGNILLAGGGTIDTRTAGTLTIGGTTQTGLTLGRAGQSTTLAGTIQAFTLAGSITGSGSPNITGIGEFSGSTGVLSTSLTTPLVTTADTLTLRTTTANPLVFQTDSTERMRIAAGGNVGIGVTGPQFKLDVAGKIGINATQMVYLPDQTDFTGSLVIGDGGQALLRDGGANDGRFNTFVGLSAGQSNTTGNNNSFFGLNAGQSNTTGSSNSFFGSSAGFNNTTGDSNSFFGLHAGISNTTGGSNSFFGRAAGSNNTTGDNNSFFGLNAGVNNTTGSSNSFFGLNAGQSNTTGLRNSFFGVSAGHNNTTGGGNLFLGHAAGRYIADGSTANATGSNNVFLGRDTKALTDGQINQIVIGFDATGIGSNSVVLGNDDVETTALKGNVGIGTTGPGQKLTVGDGTSSVFANIVSATSTIFIGESGNTRFGHTGGTAGLIFEGTSSNALAIGTFSGGDLTLGTNNQARMTIGGVSGNVGIGTTNPSEKLHVVGNARIDDGAGNAVSKGRLDVYGGRFTVHGGTALTDGYLSIERESSTLVNLQARRYDTDAVGARNLALNALGGNVGIGTTGPGAKLDVRGDGGDVLILRHSGGGIVGKVGNLGRTEIGQLLVAPKLGDTISPVFRVQHRRISDGALTTTMQITNNVDIADTIFSSTNLNVNSGQLYVQQSDGNVGIGTTDPSSFRLQTAGHVGPDAHNTYDLGSDGTRWRTGYFGTSVIAPSFTMEGLDEGSVLFAGSDGQISQNNANFFWNNAFNRFGVGTSTPAHTLDVVGDGRVTENFTIGGELTVEGSGVSLFTEGRVHFTGNPLGTGIGEGTVYVNPSIAGTNNVLLGIAVGGSERLRVDAEGDIQFTGLLNSTATAGTHQLASNLSVGRNTTLGTTSSDNVTFNARVASNIMPDADNTRNIGSPALRWSELHVVNMTVDNLISGGTASSTFIINAENTSADAEDSSLQFSRGTESPNAIIKWDSVAKRFDFNNFPVRLQNNLIVDGTATSTIAGRLHVTGTPIGTGIADGTLYVNPSSGPTNNTLFAVAVADVERFRIDAEGDTTIRASLGLQNELYNIDTDTLVINDKLQINGNEIKDSAGTTRITLGATNTVTGNLTTTGNFIAQGSGPHYFQSGNVGIGVTNPGAKLHINDGELLLQRSANVDQAFIQVLDESDSGQSRGLWLNRQGAAASPGIFFTRSGQTTLGNMIRRESAGLAFRYGATGHNYGVGTVGMVLDDSGNVGIGTTSPDEMLHVSGNVFANRLMAGNNPFDNQSLEIDGGARITGRMSVGHASMGPPLWVNAGAGHSEVVRLQVSAGATADTVGLVVKGRSSQTGDLTQWQDSAGNVLSVVDTAGNVGIGTTGPARKLEVVGGASGTETILAQIRSDGTGANTASTLRFGNSTSGSTTAGTSEISGIRTDATGRSDLIFRTSTDGANVTEKMRILANGNVGIGTTNPGAKLHVAGDLRTTGDLQVLQATDGELARIRQNSGGTNNLGYFFSVNDAAKTWTLDFSGGSIVNGVANLAIGSSNIISLKQGGNVGIGTTNPGEKLELKDEKPGLRLFSTDITNNDNKGGIEFGTGTASPSILASITPRRGSSSSEGMLLFNTRQGGTFAEVMRLDNTGNVGIGTASPNAFRLQTAGHVGPNADNTFDLGSAALRWRTLYANAIEANTITTDFTEGSVIFADASGNLAEDNTNFFWNNSTKRLGIGTTDPGAKLEVASTNQDVLLVRRDATSGQTRMRLVDNSDMGGFVQGLLGAGLALGTISSGTPSEAMRVDSAGNVGIGTTGPLQKLHVSTGVNTDAGEISIALGGTVANSRQALITKDASVSGKLSFFSVAAGAGNAPIGFFTTATDERMTILGDGNVGIGTTGPTAPLEINSDTGANTVHIVGRASDNASTLRFFNNAKSASVFLRSNGTNFGFMDGNVGIGTTGPGVKLHVNAQGTLGFTPLASTVGIFQRTAGTSNVASVGIYGGETGLARILFGDNNNEASGRITFDNSVGSLAFSTNENERMTILSGGNVGIGVTNPGAKLDVRTTGAGVEKLHDMWNLQTAAAGVGIRQSYVGAAGAIIGRTDAVFEDAGNNSYMSFWTRTSGGATEKVRINSAGNVGIGTTNPSRQLSLTDSGVGFDRVALNTLGMFTGNTERMRITDTGNIGIGTTNPGAKLHVDGDALFGNPNVQNIGHQRGDYFYSIEIPATSSSESPAYIILEKYDSGNPIDHTLGWFHIPSSGAGRYGSIWVASAAEATTPGSDRHGANYQSFISGTPNTKMVTLEYNAETYVALEISQSWIFQSNPVFTGYHGSTGADSLRGVIASEVSNVQNFSGIRTAKWSVDADTLGFLTGGNERMRITSAGNVGIGTTNPNKRLVVGGGAATEYLRIDSSVAGQAALEFAAAGAQKWVMYKPGSSNDLRLYDGSDRVTFQAGGNVGIGTTSPGDNLLRVSASGTTGIIRADDSGGNSVFRVLDRSGGQVGINTFDPNNALTVIGDADISGNVGIGTTSPGVLLHVREAGTGEIGRFETTSTGSGWIGTSQGSTARMRIGHTSSDGGGIISSGPGIANSGVIRADSGIQFATSFSDVRMTIQNTGNVGIGTTNPGKKLDITGGALRVNSTDWSQFIRDGGGAALYVNQATTTQPILRLSSGTVTPNSNVVFTVEGSGNVGIGTTSPGSKLEVAGNIVSTAFGTLVMGDNVFDGGTTGGFAQTGAAHFRAGTTTARPIRLYTDDVERMRIDASGNVGIGTTNPSSFRLQTAGHVGPNADNTFDLGSAALRWRTLYANAIEANTITTDFTEGSVIFADASGNLAEDNTNFFWNNSTKRLGIGAGSFPSSILDIRESASAGATALRQTNTAAANTSNQVHTEHRLNTDTQTRVALRINTSLNTVTDASRNSLVQFVTNQGGSFTNAMTIDGGNVGIGTTNPSQKLEVAGLIRSSQGFDLSVGDVGSARFISDSFTLNDNQVYLEWGTPSALSGAVVKITLVHTGGSISNQGLLTKQIYVDWRTGGVLQSQTSEVVNALGYVVEGSPAQIGDFEVFDTDKIRIPISWFGASSRSFRAIVEVNSHLVDYWGNFSVSSPVAHTEVEQAPFRKFEGRLGIGTASPIDKLQIVGGSLVVDNDRGIRWGGDNNRIIGQAGGIGGGRVSIFAGGSERVRVDGGGNVGIGTTSPSESLDVDGRARIRTINNAAGNILTVSGTGVVQQRTPAEIRSDIGAGTGDGTVTSVGSGTGLTGGPITTSGTLSLTGQALALHNLGTNGLIARTGAGTVAGRTITAGTGISVSNGDGVGGNPTITNTAPHVGTNLGVSHGASSVTITSSTGSNTAISGATGSAAGVVTTGTQTFAGAKTFSGAMTTNAGITNNHQTLATRMASTASTATQIPVFIADPSATTRTLVTRTPAQLRSDIGAGTGDGTVTSVGSGTGLTGGPITTSGTLSLTGQALALHNLGTNGLIARTGAGTVAGRTIAGGTAITVTNGDGVSGNPSIAVTAGSIGDTQLAFNTGQHLTTGSSPTFAGATINGNIVFTGSLQNNNIISILTTGGAAQRIRTGGILIGTSYDSSPNSNEIRTSSNQNLNINARGTGIINLQTADSTKVTLLNNGNVGIGTTSPTDKLDVRGNIQMPQDFRYIRGNSGTGPAFIQFTRSTSSSVGGYGVWMSWNSFWDGSKWVAERTDLTSNLMQAGVSHHNSFSVRSGSWDGNEITWTDRFNVQDNGNVNIPSGSLSLASGTSVNEISTNTNLGTSNNALATQAAIKTYVDNAAGSGFTGSGTANFVTKWQDSDTLTDSVIYDDGTNVGIGTTNPDEKLDVRGSITIPLASGSSNNLIVGSEGHMISQHTNELTLYPNRASGASFKIRSHLDGASFRTDLTVDSSGNLGIGTTNPGHKLEVIGGSHATTRFHSAGFTDIEIMSDRTSGNIGALEFIRHDGQRLMNIAGTVEGKLHIRDDGSSLFTVQSDGNVGIGPTSPSFTLDVSGTGRFTSTLRTDGALQVGGATTVITAARVAQNLTGLSSSGTITFSGLTANRIVATDGSSNLTSSISAANLHSSVTGTTGTAGNLVFSASPTFTGNIDFPGSGRWTSDGNVGIGTTSPDAKLAIQGDGIATASGAIHFSHGGTGMSLGINTADTKLMIGNSWNPGSGTYLTIENSTGNVGIGTTNPGAQLEIQKGAATGSTFIKMSESNTIADSTVGIDWFMRTNQDKAGRIAVERQSTGANYDMVFYGWSGGTGGASTPYMTIRNAGNVGIGQTSPSFALDVSGTGRFTGALTLGTQATATTHAVRADRTLTAGTGLSGGGNLTANRSFAVDYGSTAGTAVQGNTQITISAGTNVTGGGTITLGAGGSVTLNVPTSPSGQPVGVNRTLTAGDGLTGGGNLSANRTFSVSAGDGISVGASTGVAVDSTVVRTSGNQSIGGIKTFSSQIRAADGSASAPAYSFSSSTNTGMYHIGGNILGFATGGSARFRVTDTAVEPITAGAIDLGTLGREWNNIQGRTIRGINSLTQEKIRLTTDGTNSWIDSGNVGIGTTGPIDRLQVAGNIRLDSGNNDLIRWFDGGNRRAEIGRSGTNLRINSRLADVIIEANDVERMRITSAGNVGIGITNPTEKLHVVGTARFSPSILLQNAFGHGLTCDTSNLGELAASTNFSPIALHICAGQHGWRRIDVSGSGAPDIAEYVVIQDESIEAGELVSVSLEPREDDNIYDTFFVERATPENRERILGIISSDPGMILNEPAIGENLDDIPDTSHLRPLALTGRVPLKVSNENGIIQTGDYIAVSPSIPGYGAKAVEQGMVIGKALNSADPAEDTDTILVFIVHTYYAGMLSELSGGIITLDDLDPETSRILDEDEETTFFDAFAKGVKRVLADAGVTVKDGTVKLKELVADKMTVKTIIVNDLYADRVETKELCVDDVCVTRDEFKRMVEQSGSVSTTSGGSTTEDTTEDTSSEETSDSESTTEESSTEESGSETADDGGETTEDTSSEDTTEDTASEDTSNETEDTTEDTSSEETSDSEPTTDDGESTDSGGDSTESTDDGGSTESSDSGGDDGGSTDDGGGSTESTTSDSTASSDEGGEE